MNEPLHAALHDGPENIPQAIKSATYESCVTRLRSTHTRIPNNLVKGVTIGIVQDSAKKDQGQEVT
jgi:hypothetical protein